MKTMISASEAKRLVMEHVAPLDAREMASADSLGRVLGKPVVADRDYPPFDRATMDGFAVRVAHAGKTVAVRGEARPGLDPPPGPDAEACVAIMTGAPCPSGTEAVVMKEVVRSEPGQNGEQVLMPAEILPGQNIVRAGSECAKGRVVLPEGAEMTALTIGLVAAVGQETVWARRAPSLRVLVTGDEVVQSVDTPGHVQIRDSNGPMITAMAHATGVTDLVIYSVRDTTEALAAALDRASDGDVVVLTGGVSAGNYDLVPQALTSHGATIIFHKVRQQPGKPLLFAVKGRRLFFGLPGTPLGCHLGFFRYVIPALRGLAGQPPGHRTREGRMGAPWSTKSDREQFVLARAARHGDSWTVTPLLPIGSSDLFTPWSANAYMNVPEGTRELMMGATTTFQLLAP